MRGEGERRGGKEHVRTPNLYQEMPLTVKRSLLVKKGGGGGRNPPPRCIKRKGEGNGEGSEGGRDSSYD